MYSFIAILIYLYTYTSITYNNTSVYTVYTHYRVYLGLYTIIYIILQVRSGDTIYTIIQGDTLFLTVDASFRLGISTLCEITHIINMHTYIIHMEDIYRKE